MMFNFSADADNKMQATDSPDEEEEMLKRAIAMSFEE